MLIRFLMNNGMEASEKRILCVEDHQDMCELRTKALSYYEVIGAYSKADALTRAMGESFDLYLLDQHLPDGTGFELCRLIRTFNPDTPIFFCADTDSVSETIIKMAGAQRLIRKGDTFVSELRIAVSLSSSFCRPTGCAPGRAGQ